MCLCVASKLKCNAEETFQWLAPFALTHKIHDKQAQRYTPRTNFSFFKEKTALGFESTTPRSRRVLYQLSYQGGSVGTCIYIKTLKADV